MPMTDRLRAAWPSGLAMLVALTLTGCSTTAENSGLSLVDASGNHPAGFVSTHPSLVRGPADADQCEPCHGDGLTGGIANVSCFTATRDGTACHHPAPATWETPAVHGAAAKGSPGLSSCQVCHGIDFAGGGSGVACADCHGPAHPDQWQSTSTYKHTTTDAANAPVCALCHFNEPGGGSHPPADPPPGSNPGCFNDTLCHGARVPLGTHTTGWLNSGAGAAFHGQSGLSCGECHPISGHPTCTTCHFDENGSRNNATLNFAHTGDVNRDHRRGALAAVGNVCENCHQTSRTYGGGEPSGCGPGQNHPGNKGCHYDNALLNPVLNNPRY